MSPCSIAPNTQKRDKKASIGYFSCFWFNWLRKHDCHELEDTGFRLKISKRVVCSNYYRSFTPFLRVHLDKLSIFSYRAREKEKSNTRHVFSRVNLNFAQPDCRLTSCIRKIHSPSVSGTIFCVDSNNPRRTGVRIQVHRLSLAYDRKMIAQLHVHSSCLN